MSDQSVPAPQTGADHAGSDHEAKAAALVPATSAAALPKTKMSTHSRRSSSTSASI